MTTIIGASAMIGIVCEATIQGISDFSSAFRLTMTMASAMPSAEPIDEAEQGLLQGDEAVIDEAALGRRRGLQHGLVEFADDLMGRGKFRALHIEIGQRKVAEANNP